MKIEGTGLEEKEVNLHDLDHAAQELGFVRWAWDYRRATFDFKYEDKKLGEVYYLRVPTTSVKGEIEEESFDSIVKIGQPYLGRHTYPHGLDYDFDFPKNILEDAKNRLQKLNSHL